MKSGEGALQRKLENVSDDIGAVILSRFSSQRLPGKALMRIREKPVLQYIVEKLAVVFSRRQIVIATSDTHADNPIADFAEKVGVDCFRGSLENVADRFFQAAKSQGWAYATRINGDNIFVDSNVLHKMKQAAQSGKYDFISNVKGRTFPKGMSIEMVRVSYYQELLEKINLSREHQEHVTSYLYDHDEGQNYLYVTNADFPEAAGIQFALDTKDDFERSKKIIEQFTVDHIHYNMKEIYSIYEKKLKGMQGPSDTH